VGIYDVDHAVGEVRNLVFDGPGAPTYPRFPMDAGLTGVAIREGRTVNVGDVAENPVYLTALGTTRSEIIIPIFDGARRVVVGTLDVESEKLHAFGEGDQILLEDYAEALRPLWAG
jgi:GAF domain-containing protein